MNTSNTAAVARIVADLIELLDRANSVTEATWLRDRLPAIQSPASSDEWASTKALLRSRATGMGSLTDLVLRPTPESGLDKAEANERLAELTDTLFQLTRPLRMIPLERVLEILAPHLIAMAAQEGTQIIATSAKRVGNTWQVTYNTIDFAESGNELDGLLGNRPLEVSDDGVVTGVEMPSSP